MVCCRRELNWSASQQAMCSTVTLSCCGNRLLSQMYVKSCSVCFRFASVIATRLGQMSVPQHEQLPNAGLVQATHNKRARTLLSARTMSGNFNHASEW